MGNSKYVDDKSTNEAFKGLLKQPTTPNLVGKEPKYDQTPRDNLPVRGA